MKPRCSIVIRAYNEEAHIGRLLSGIMQQSVKDIQIILVDSGSSDSTVSIASRYPVDIVAISPREFTFGRSLNFGISHASSEFVVIASAHVFPVYPDWLERLLEPFDQSQVALTYGKQRGGEYSRFSERQIFHQWYPDHPRPSQKHPFCNNANAAIRQSLWQQHRYDEALSGLEDLEWARWAQDASYQIIYAPEAEVIHVHNETWRGIYNRYRREAMAFKQIYPQETFRLIDFFRFWGGNCLHDMRIAQQQSQLFAALVEIIRYRLNQFWGTYRGYRQSGSLTWELRQAFYYPLGLQTQQLPLPERNQVPIRYQDVERSSPGQNLNQPVEDS